MGLIGTLGTKETNRDKGGNLEDNKRSLTSEIRLWVSDNPGRRFTFNTLDNELGISNSVAKNYRGKVVRRLIDDNIVERYREAYRVVANGLVSLDWAKASKSSVLDLKWPFELEKYVNILPKNIIIVAGSKDSGKTAFLLDFIRRNMDNHKINYFSSEMGELELKMRLQKFEDTNIIPMSDWKFQAYERAFDFHDVIKPDEINVIDFLEIHENFFEIAGRIFQIWDKHTTGIAVIALQKNEGVALGLGGARSLEKARLYLSMDRNRLKIESGKNWKDTSVNPRGKEWTFQLVQGCKFVNIIEATQDMRP